MTNSTDGRNPMEFHVRGLSLVGWGDYVGLWLKREDNYPIRNVIVF